MRGPGRPAASAAARQRRRDVRRDRARPALTHRCALHSTAREFEHPRSERGQQNGRAGGGDVELPVGRHLVTVDVGLLAGEQGLQTIDEVAGECQRPIPGQAHARLHRLLRRRADAEGEPTVERALCRTGQLRQADGMSSVQGDHRRAHLRESGGLVSGTCQRDDGINGVGMGDPQAVEPSRHCEARDLANLLDRRQRDATSETPTHPETVTGHPAMIARAARCRQVTAVRRTRGSSHAYSSSISMFSTTQNAAV